MKQPTHMPNKLEKIAVFILFIITNIFTSLIMNYIDRDYTTSNVNWITAYIIVAFGVFMALQCVFNFFYAIWQRFGK